jgi:spore germination cell wall hydrolase CwlJ-like protein
MTSLFTKKESSKATHASALVLMVSLCVVPFLHAAQAPSDYCSGIFEIERDMLENLTAHEQTTVSTNETNFVEEEIRCLALNIYFEARSEPEQGQRAVGHVVMNRVANEHYPDTACDVIKQGGEERLNRCQFSWWCDGRSDKPVNEVAWETSLRLADEIYFGESTDPTDGALWYHADYVDPYWNDSLRLVKKIGQHSFYLHKKQTEYALN